MSGEPKRDEDLTDDELAARLADLIKKADGEPKKD